MQIKLLDKQRETNESRRLYQTKTSYPRKGIQIYLKTERKKKKKKTGQKTRTAEAKIKLKTKSERKLK